MENADKINKSTIRKIIICEINKPYINVRVF